MRLSNLRLLIEIALTHIRGRARQTLVSILGVAMGVGFAIAMAALMQGSQAEFTRTLIAAMPSVQITDERRAAPRQPAEDAFAVVAWSGLRPRDDPRGVLNPTAIEAGLRALGPGAISAGLSVSAVARYAGQEVGVSVLGVTPADEAAVSTIDDDMTIGRLEDLAGRADGVVVGDGLLRKLGAEPGDSLAVSTGAGATRRLEVIGVFDSGVGATDDVRVYTLLKTAQVLAGRPSAVNDIRLKLPDGADVDAVARRAEAMFGYKAVSWLEANRTILESFQVRNVIMYTVVAAILVVATFGIFNIVSIITYEKSRDIAILKSLGFTAGDMRTLFLAEGLAMGVIGSALGFALGYGLTAALGSVTISFPNAQGPVYLPVVYEPLHYVIAAAAAVGAAAVAGYLPARKASAVHPVDIIRGAT